MFVFALAAIFAVSEIGTASVIRPLVPEPGFIAIRPIPIEITPEEEIPNTGIQIIPVPGLEGCAEQEVPSSPIQVIEVPGLEDPAVRPLPVVPEEEIPSSPIQVIEVPGLEDPAVRPLPVVPEVVPDVEACAEEEVPSTGIQIIPVPGIEDHLGPQLLPSLPVVVPDLPAGWQPGDFVKPFPVPEVEQGCADAEASDVIRPLPIVPDLEVPVEVAPDVEACEEALGLGAPIGQTFPSFPDAPVGQVLPEYPQAPLGEAYNVEALYKALKATSNFRRIGAEIVIPIEVLDLPEWDDVKNTLEDK